MKNYFKQLFSYDRHANHQLLKAITDNSSPAKAVGLMSHLLRAHQVWLPRLTDEPVTAGTLWPDWQVEELGAMIDENYTRWITYFDSLNEGDFEKVITYKTLSVMSFENNLTDILSHVINHGTHHRAQIGQQLLFAGATQLPPTDLIFYLRDNK